MVHVRFEILIGYSSGYWDSSLIHEVGVPAGDTSLRVSVGIIVRAQSLINMGGQDGMGRWRHRAWCVHWSKRAEYMGIDAGRLLHLSWEKR